MGAVKLAKVIPITMPGLKHACAQCNLRELCLPFGLNADEVQQLDDLVADSRPFKKGDYLYHAGDHFNAIYVIKTGFFKTAVLVEDGREQVTGFHMGGEIIGMDGIGGDIHICSAVAIEDCTVCQVPFSRLEELTRTVPTLQQHFMRIMSREIVRDQGVMMLLGTMPAEQRLVVFLLNLSQRFAVRGYSANEFQLRMTREEIGSYLGMKLETVSRALSHLQDQGLISIKIRQVRLNDMAGLKGLLASAGSTSKPTDHVAVNSNRQNRPKG